MTITDKLDRPLRDLRISVTDRCNFRCVYCMPKEVFGSDYQFLERSEILSFEEITRLQTEFLHHQMQTFAQQAQELGQSASRTAVGAVRPGA